MRCLLRVARTAGGVVDCFFISDILLTFRTTFFDADNELVLAQEADPEDVHAPVVLGRRGRDAAARADRVRGQREAAAHPHRAGHVLVAQHR